MEHNNCHPTASNGLSMTSSTMTINKNNYNNTHVSNNTQSISSSPSPSSSSSTSTVLWKNRLVLSILITETAERFAYFGFRAILVLYFTEGLQLSDATSISLCAGTVALAYFSPLIGAVLADDTWGRYPTIWRFGLMYALGLILVTWAAYQTLPTSSTTEDDEQQEESMEDSPPPSLAMARFFTFVGLFFICVGTGGIKPCVSAFGADQVLITDDDANGSSSSSSCNKQNISEEDRFYDEPQSAHPLPNDKNPVVSHSTTSGSSKAAARQERIREFFNSFYFCVNVGALASFALIPMVRAHLGYGACFLILTLAMILALFVFQSQRHHYHHRKHRRKEDSEPTLLFTFYISYQILVQKVQQGWRSTIKSMTTSTTTRCRRNHSNHTSVDQDVALCQPAYTHHNNIGEETASSLSSFGQSQVYHDASQALHILPLMAFFPIFWMLYDQQGSVWTLQATRMKLHGWEPEQLQILNPLEIMIFIPLFDWKIYPYLQRKGYNIQPLRRMEYGMLLTAISFAVSAWLEHAIMQTPPPQKVSVAWQIPQITLLTVAEILLNVTGLEFAYSQAPSNMQALILAWYLFMTAIGDGLAAILYGSVFAHMSVITPMILCTVAMLVNLVLFSMVASRWTPYNRRRIDEEDEVLFATSGGDGVDGGVELRPMVEHQH